jgi:protein-arginine kinase activator protein McsA
MSEQEIWKKCCWNGKFHPEIENAITIPHEQKENLQFMLENNFNNDFEELLKDMLQYSLIVEDYESSVEIRDYINDKEETKI